MKLRILLALGALLFAAELFAATSSDNFNRANNTDLGADWTPSCASIEIISNTAQSNAGSVNACEYKNDISPSANQFSQITLSGGPPGVSSAYVGAAVRIAAGAATLYSYSVAGLTSTEIFKLVANSYTMLASNGTTWAVNDVLRIEVIGTAGTNLTGYKNGVSNLTASDSAITSGNVGIYMFESVEVDDWSGGDLGAAATRIRHGVRVQ